MISAIKSKEKSLASIDNCIQWLPLQLAMGTGTILVQSTRCNPHYGRRMISVVDCNYNIVQVVMVTITVAKRVKVISFLLSVASRDQSLPTPFIDSVTAV